jgi:hypothetical protein
MAESSRDSKPTEPESEKKQPETVQLTAEELRAIAGGAAVTPGDPGKPPVSSQDILGRSGGAKK